LRKQDISIIVVDDLHFSREVIRHNLQKAGFEKIRTAASGNEAILELNRESADLVIADFWMPGINGLDLTQLIRQWDHSRQHYTGIILLTAEDSSDAIEAAFVKGVDDFVSKSAPSHELAARAYGCGRIAVQFNQHFDEARHLSERCMLHTNLACMDSETGLPNRLQLIEQLNNLREHCSTRGGGYSVLMLELAEPSHNLPLNTHRAVASALRLVLRPLDMVSREGKNRYVVVYQYANPHLFSPLAVVRTLDSLIQHSNALQTVEQAQALRTHEWRYQPNQPVPQASEVLDLCQDSLQAYDWSQSQLNQGWMQQA